MDLLYSLPQNILKRIEFIKQDYTTFIPDPKVFVVFSLSLSFALFSIFLFYSFGKKVISPSQKTTKNYDYLFFIATGFVLISSGIAILGFFSLLTPAAIIIYLLFVFAYSFFRPLSLRKNFFDLLSSIKNDYLHLKMRKFVFVWTLLFILIALLNLINPEVREDQYHVDLPVMYLKNQTIMIEPREEIKVSASPLLAEMHYALAILLLSKEASRYIHFVFYLLVLLALLNFSRIKNYKFAIYTPVIFASAPVVIHETSSMYVDFQWLFLFLLSVLLLLDQKEKFATAKSGFLFGGMIATKLWTIVFSVVPALYLLTVRDKITNKSKSLFFFFSLAVVTSFIWFFRAYILTGSPFYPAFDSSNSYNYSSFFDSISKFIGINYQLIDIFSYINVFSSLFFFSFVFIIFKLGENVKTLLSLSFFRYVFFLLVLYLIIKYPFGRYLLGLYVLFIFVSALAINNILKLSPVKTLLNFLLFIIFSYYAISSILVLPYAFGIANKNNYLSRILIRDASSYYDFGGKFNKYISKKDKVAMYNFHGYYYADFNYSDLQFIYEKNEKSLNVLKQKKFTKLLTRSFTLKEMCSNLNFKKCDAQEFRLISSYGQFPFFYLYDIK